ncbi:MAG: PadR family transcriptional regulator [Candidatus Bathyarchaeota archaeon]|nr:MAG: PadR family transcriptional regulator [Candidatus Bathyarchaeota archaeon]
MAYDRLVRKLTKENLWLYILKMLVEESMYAYEIKKALVDRFNISAATVTVYVVLHKMEREGLIKTGKRMSVLGRPDRIYYDITDEGIQTLQRGRDFINASLKRLI